MKKISIIIPIYNRLEVTKLGLRSLKSSLKACNDDTCAMFQFQIIVIDDGSDDGSYEWIEANYDDIILLKGDGNLWWSGAVDMGSRHAILQENADYVMLWNDDLQCDDNYFKNLCHCLASNEKYSNSIIVSKILWLDNKDTIFNFGCQFNSKTGQKILIGTNQYDKGFDQIIPVDWSGGMGTLIPKEILLKINFFDPLNFPQYHGDSDMFLRAKKSGYSTYAIPNLILYNNKETTGVKSIKKLKDLIPFFTSNRSNYNLVQNIKFTKRHCSSSISWLYLAKTYFKVIAISIRDNI